MVWLKEGKSPHHCHHLILALNQKEEMAEMVEEEIAVDMEGYAEEGYRVVVEEYLNRKDQTIIKKELKMGK